VTDSKHSIIKRSRYPLADFRSAKRAWSMRLLAPAPAAAARPVARGRRITSVPRRVADRRNPNVVGVGLAEKTVDGKPTGVLAVKFFVRTKVPKSGVSAGQMLPKAIDGLPVDVEESGPFRAFAKRASGRSGQVSLPNPRARTRPVRPGCSIGFRIAGDEFLMTGTFGALVKTTRGAYVLSNNHVLADENRLPLRSPIYQPALMDRGRVATDKFAELARFIKLRADRYNQIDAALAVPLTKTIVAKDILHIGAPKGTAAAALDMIVHKFGRTTAYTVGRVTSVDTDVIVEYETAEFSFSEQIIIRGLGSAAFSDSGDSGALVLERDSNAAVGLLFGGSATYTIANHIAKALRSLRVRMG
jgi:hypothetical protein